MASDTRVHSSPPSITDIYAAEHALKINRLRGDILRNKLAQNVARLRSRLRDAGINNLNSSFPVQAISVPEQIAERVYWRLRQRGVRAVLQQFCVGQKPCVSFVITARHNRSELDNASKVVMGVFCEFEWCSEKANKYCIH